MSKKTFDEIESWGVMKYGRPPSVDKIVERQQWFYRVEEDILVEAGLARRTDVTRITVVNQDAVREADWIIFKRIHDAKERVRNKKRN